MTTNKQMFDVADKMAEAIVKLTKGLATDGTALEGFIDAMNVQNEWAAIKLKRSMERMCRRAGVVENFAHEPTKEPQTEALNKHNVMESLPPEQFPDTEADGYVFCGKCGKMK